MSLLSKVSYWKIQYLGSKIELRSTLNVIGLVSDHKAEAKNRRDVFKVLELTRNLNPEDKKRIDEYASERINKVGL